MDKKKEVILVLDSLLQEDDIIFCMLTTSTFGGIAPSKQKFQSLDIARLFKDTTTKMFSLMDDFIDYKLERINLELKDYIIVIAPVSVGFGLIVLVPSMSNLGLLDVRVENTKNKIKEILQRK